MFDKPTKPVLALVAIGAGLLVAMGLLGNLAPKPEPKRVSGPVVSQPIPDASAPDAFDRGEAGLSAGAEVQYKERVIGAWRAAGGACATPIKISFNDAYDYLLLGMGADKVLEIGLVKPGVVRAEVAKPKAEKGQIYEFSVGLIASDEAARAPITVSVAGGAPQTWEPCE